MEMMYCIVLYEGNIRVNERKLMYKKVAVIKFEMGGNHEEYFE